MSDVTFVIKEPSHFSVDERITFEELLRKQNKVRDVSAEKVERCKYICFCFVNNQPVSIGALKPKTTSDFRSFKANVPDLENQFDWELGYLFTLDNHTRKGYSSRIVDELIAKAGKINLMASTELKESNSMKRILEGKGFKKHGMTWKSGMHGGDLGLFLKFA